MYRPFSCRGAIFYRRRRVRLAWWMFVGLAMLVRPWWTRRAHAPVNDFVVKERSVVVELETYGTNNRCSGDRRPNGVVVFAVVGLLATKGGFRLPSHLIIAGAIITAFGQHNTTQHNTTQHNTTQPLSSRRAAAVLGKARFARKNLEKTFPWLFLYFDGLD